MQTKETVRLGFLDTVVAEYEADNVKNGRPYKNRILDAGQIVAKHGVVRIAKGEYKVESSGNGNTTYRVNGTCSCPDGKPGPDGQSKAPHGWCKHRMSVRIEVRVEARLKELTDLSVPHPHTWNCDTHRDLPIECWTRCCPDPLKIPCATCATMTHTDESEPPFITIDQATGEILETPTMMTTIGETAKHIVSNLNGHANGTSATEPTPAPLVPEEYEEAPALTTKRPDLPEAPVSMYIKFKVENFEISYTMRAHTDSEVIARLPGVLAGLEEVLKIEVDHEESFTKRLLHAFFPKPSRYTGK